MSVQGSLRPPPLRCVEPHNLFVPAPRPTKTHVRRGGSQGLVQGLALPRLRPPPLRRVARYRGGRVRRCSRPALYCAPPPPPPPWFRVQGSGLSNLWCFEFSVVQPTGCRVQGSQAYGTKWQEIGVVGATALTRRARNGRGHAPAATTIFGDVQGLGFRVDRPGVFTRSRRARCCGERCTPHSELYRGTSLTRKRLPLGVANARRELQYAPPP